MVQRRLHNTETSVSIQLIHYTSHSLLLEGGTEQQAWSHQVQPGIKMNLVYRVYFNSPTTIWTDLFGSFLRQTVKPGIHSWIFAGSTGFINDVAFQPLAALFLLTLPVWQEGNRRPDSGDQLSHSVFWHWPGRRKTICGPAEDITGLILLVGENQAQSKSGACHRDTCQIVGLSCDTLPGFYSINVLGCRGARRGYPRRPLILATKKKQQNKTQPQQQRDKDPPPP